MNDIVPQNQNSQLPSNMTPTQLTEMYRKMAEQQASTERRIGTSISVRNGIMSVGDQPIPGNQFAAVILDAARLNTFYPTAFNPQSMDPPVCYAVGRDDAELAPHKDMQKDLNYFKPQADHCSACPHNEFGSGRTGQGKACTNRRRLFMLLAGTYNMTAGGLQMAPFMEASHYETTSFLQMTLPPTSLKAWGEYVRGATAQYQRPYFGLITRVYLYPHPKHGKEAIGFETLAPIPDDWAPAVFGRFNEAQSEILQGYEPPQNRHPGGGFHGAQQHAQQGG